MLTLSRLMNNTPNAVRRRAAGQCRLTKIQKKTVGPRTNKIVEHHWGVACTDGVRVITVKFHGPVAKTTPVWVSCTCPAWLFFCEVAVAGAGSTDVLYSNGAAPVVRNPSGTPYLCKHIYAVAAVGIDETKVPNLLQKLFPSKGPRPPGIGTDPATLRKRWIERAKQQERELIDFSKSLDFTKPSLLPVPDKLKEKLLDVEQVIEDEAGKAFDAQPPPKPSPSGLPGPPKRGR